MRERLVTLEQVVKTAAHVPVVRNVARFGLERVSTPEQLRQLEIDSLRFNVSGVKERGSWTGIADQNEETAQLLERRDPIGSLIKPEERPRIAYDIVFNYRAGHIARKQASRGERATRFFR